MNVVPTVSGEPIRLNLQLSDGEESLPLVVKAFLKDDEGIELLPDPITLGHVGLGLFKNFSVIMPEDIPEITAQYVVYEQDGITQAPYSIDADIFRTIEAKDEVNVEAVIARLSTEALDIDIDEDEAIDVDIEEAN
jgi:hypothetical protein